MKCTSTPMVGIHIWRSHAKPRPSATPRASWESMFTSTETTRSRTAGTVTRESSKRNAAMMWRFSATVWLRQNSVAWE